MDNIAENIQKGDASMARVEFYDHVPGFVEPVLENLYQSLFTTMARMDMYGIIKNAHTYVLRDAEKVLAVFIFRCEGNQVTVYNEQISIEGEDIKRFSDAIFLKYQSVSLISFYAINADIATCLRPFQKLNCLEDVVVQLPRKADDYLRALSENTRTSIRKSQKKLKLHLPSIQFQICSKDEVSEEQIRSLIALSRARMSAKKRRFHYDEDAIKKLVKLIRKYGIVMIAKSVSGICGGTICYRIGEHYFMHILAHDPKYNEYGLGKLCCYLSVCNAIDNGATAYHFGWGRTNYKYAMGAKNVDLYRIEIYRSRMRLVGNVGHFFKMRISCNIRRYKLWMECIDQGNTKLNRRIVVAIKTLRKIKSYFRVVD